MTLSRLAFGLLAIALVSGAPPTSRENEPASSGQLRPGMAPAEVRQILGPPHHVARQVLYHRYLEQWVYSAPASMRVEFDCPRGQASRLVTATATGNDSRP